MNDKDSWNKILHHITTCKETVDSDRVLNTVERERKPTKVYVSNEHLNNRHVEKKRQETDIYIGKPVSNIEKKPPEIIVSSYDAQSTNGCDVERCARSKSPVPPPLPSCAPPSILKRYDSSEFLNECDVTENKIVDSTGAIEYDKNSKIENPQRNVESCDIYDENGILVDDLTIASHNGSDTDSDSSSDASGHYNLSAYYSVFKSGVENTNKNNNSCVPYSIDNLKDEMKTVRSKIKPGTVEDMKQLFVKKGKRKNKRLKSKDLQKCKSEHSDISPGTKIENKASKYNRVSSLNDSGDQIPKFSENDTNHQRSESNGRSSGVDVDDKWSITGRCANDQTKDSTGILSNNDTHKQKIKSSRHIFCDGADDERSTKCLSSAYIVTECTGLNHEEKHIKSYVDVDKRSQEIEENKTEKEIKTEKINDYTSQNDVMENCLKLDKSDQSNITEMKCTLNNQEIPLNESRHNFTGGDVLKQNTPLLNKSRLHNLVHSTPGESRSGTKSYNINRDVYQSHSLKPKQGQEATLEGQCYLSKHQLLAKEKNKFSGERDDTINKQQTTSYVDCVKSETDDMLCQAYLTSGSKDGIIDDHVTSTLTDVQLSTYTHPQHDSNRIQVLTQADVKPGESVGEFSDQSDTETATIVVLKELSLKSKMPEKSSGQAKTAESSEYIGGKKISTKITTSRTCNGDTVSEEQNDNTEASNALAALAEAVAKINEDNKDDMLPEINQSVTKLNGGNLVITTLTRKIVEEENVEEGSHSSGRGSPVENKNSNVFIVQDHKGDTYMVEDITDDSQESAYFSSIDSRHTSESSGHYDISGYNSPRIQGVNNLQAVGRTGIDYSTAEEVLLGLFNPNYSGELVETGEYSYERDRSGMSKTSQLQVQPYGYVTDSSFNKKTTTLEYDRQHEPTPQITYPMGASSVKTVKSSYEMSAPWVVDGSNGYILDQTDGEEYNMRKEESVETTNVDQTGINSMSAAYLLQGSYQVPQVPQIPQPVPYPIITPLVIPDQSQIRLHKLDITPNIDQQVIELVPHEEQKTVETETVECKNTASFVSAEYKSGGGGGGEQTMVIGPDEVDSAKKVSEVERPVYKTVALVKGPYDTPKWSNTRQKDEPDTNVIDTRKYKILNSRASDETQEKTMSFNESHAYRVNRTENYENEKKRFMDENQNFHYSYSSPKTYVVNDMQTPELKHRYRTEKHFQVNGSPDTNKKHRTHIEVSRDHIDGKRGVSMGNFENREEKKYVTKKEMKAEEFYRMNPEPIHMLNSDASSDIKVVRGNILIKNTMDAGLDEFNDNINVFDTTFNLNKENPLYQSDEDIFKRYESERLQQQNQHHSFRRPDPREDITFETVDRYTKTKEVKREPEKLHPKQNLSQILLSRLSTIDAKDIRQHIDVKHHNEEIYGDISFIHADGSRCASGGTQNFDSVSEDIDLALRDGKAYITIKVTAERISPIDIEFNVWRKNQAIVTRLIEIDLLANEQRRRLYHRVMETDGSNRHSGSHAHSGSYGHSGSHGHSGSYGHSGSHGHSGYQTHHGNLSDIKPQETILSSADTLNLFAEIMNATDGEGDQEDITVKTSQSKTVKPSAFLY